MASCTKTPTTVATPTRVEPRPYQRRIVSKALDLFERQDMCSVLLESPTGSGKTVMGLLIARALQARLGIRVGWVAMRRNLLAQARAENEAHAIGVEATYLSMFDRDPPPGLDLLVVDEAQHDAVASMAHLHEVIQPRFILGLSATPFRADRIKLCFNTVVKDAGIHALIQDGYLSPYHHYTLPEYSPTAVAECYAAEAGRWGKSIAYFHTLPQCRAALEHCRRLGVRCDLVTGTSDREAQLDAFRDGAYDLLINCMVLVEGFDCPELRTVFCRPSAKGPTIQMCGRVLRQHPNLPHKQIVQCVKTRWPFGRTAAAAQQFVRADGSWRTLEANPLIHQLSGRMLHALARTTVELPAYLLRQQAQVGPSRRRRRDDVSE